MDVIIWIDILFSAITAVVGPNNLIKDFTSIMRHYTRYTQFKKYLCEAHARYYFVLDVAAALPLYLLLKDLLIVKILRVVHLPRGYKVVVDALVVFLYSLTL